MPRMSLMHALMFVFMTRSSMHLLCVSLGSCNSLPPARERLLQASLPTYTALVVFAGVGFVDGASGMDCLGGR
eukprot:4920100-Lingulodinium_polyedra.AAC.1